VQIWIGIESSRSARLVSGQRNSPLSVSLAWQKPEALGKDLVAKTSIERQTELVLEQLKLCVEGWLLAGKSPQMQCLLHVSGEIRGHQHDLCALLSEQSAGADFRLRAAMVRRV
jgi:hypothetical protein